MWLVLVSIGVLILATTIFALVPTDRNVPPIGNHLSPAERAKTRVFDAAVAVCAAVALVLIGVGETLAVLGVLQLLKPFLP